MPNQSHSKPSVDLSKVDDYPNRSRSSARYSGDLISVFCDASVDNQGYAGWGAWARNKGTRIMSGGAFPQCVLDSNEAELWAIHCGISMAIEGGLIKRGDSVLVQSDNLRAVSAMPFWSPRKDLLKSQRVQRQRLQPRKGCTEKHLLQQILKLATTYGIRIMGRHIKGHADKDASARNFINHACDLMAKRGVQLAQKDHSKIHKHVSAMPGDYIPWLLFENHVKADQGQEFNLDWRESRLFKKIAESRGGGLVDFNDISDDDVDSLFDDDDDPSTW